MSLVPFPFTTITAADWPPALAAARRRQAPEARRARIFTGPLCPVCRRPGLHQEITGGTRIVHDPRAEPCWHPAASGHVSTQQEAA